MLLFDDSLRLGVLTSSLHVVWVTEYVSSLETRLRYVPTDCLETFPFPKTDDATATFESAERYHDLRFQIMKNRQEGLTKLYNRVNNPLDENPDINNLRNMYSELDNAVATAYGWQDIALDHGFYKTKQGVRFTISEVARREVLDRLLALNHQRHAEEEAERAALPILTSAKRGRKSKDSGGQITMDL